MGGSTTASEDKPVRVLVACARQDRKLAKKLVRILRRRTGVEPAWDGGDRSREGSIEDVRERIAAAQVFMPVLSRDGLRSPRVHQETGLALALGIPVVPVVARTLPEAFAASAHFVRAGKGFADLERRAGELDLAAIAASRARSPETALVPRETPPAVVASVAAIVHRAPAGSDGLLLIRRDARDPWSLPAGDIEPYESAEEAAVRTVRSAVGLTLEAELFGHFDDIAPREGRHEVVLAFVGPAGGEIATDAAPGLEVAWHSVLDALQLELRPLHRRVLEDFAGGI